MCEISYMENYLIKMIILYTSQSNLCMKKSMILFTFMNIEKEYRYVFFSFFVWINFNRVTQSLK